MSVPYIIGYPIKDPNDFYGFRRTVKEIYDIIGGRQAQSISILGLKRSGKTSLLYYLAHRSVLAHHVANPDAYVTLYVDFSICHTPTEFYNIVYHGLLHRLFGLSAPKYEQVEKPDSTDITWLLSQFPKRRAMILLDEFDHLTHGAFDQDFLCQLRSIAVAHDTDLAFITGSFKSLKHIGGSLGLPSTSPFYNIFYPSYFYLSGLNKTEVADLIRCPAEQDDVFFTGEEMSNIQAIAGTLPFLLQMSACKVFLAKRDAQSLTQDNFQKELIEDAGPFFETWWRDIGEENQLLLSEITQKESVSDKDFQNPALEERLRFLKNYGLVIETEGRLRINGLALATWIKLQVPKQHDKPSTSRLKKKVGKSAKCNSKEKSLILIFNDIEDKLKVHRLFMQLKQDSFDPWSEDECILPGQDRTLEIEKALQHSRAILLCFSKNSVQKEGALQSGIRRAIKYQEEKPEGAIFIIPVLLDACETPESIRHLVGVNLFETDSYNKLLQAIIPKNKEC